MAEKISAAQVKLLREQTGAGMMDAKAALAETNGVVASAIELLRKKGVLKAGKKSDRITKQGLIHAYIHGEGRIGVLLEVNCETDFVARNEDFKGLVHDLALHIAASNPLYVSREEVPSVMVEKEKSIYLEQVQMNPPKADNIIEKIVEGKLEKFYEQICLLEQPFVKDSDVTVKELVTQKIATIGENIQVRRFTRYVLGE
ncbi:MAG: translation elongation factor Ts [Candidatus Doudnabacteria bacterium RIFCSPHIGHO2_02_FULL_48_21]|uniref:Elongation factor Ts n=1 Tax=Candidatus Doudnabacteria bacterium RIFCSPLOWO2_02_FULL_48_13 TaxID=1817845 RepID=A0A1F5QA15_9BACT|nr:MAG: translation elongation factor Ts [Candidatus Doudnabacteria bacterium RIFCSPHIGHO2_01_48_18]OGE78457.1 MAG: translation elongation factor Ts [Candidatus Doudnabacteria bacterium RIFCSPHIGHO2_01_FULL_48_180]OGE91711.1 MAG: translation elongation factor Ts [Candidatus Doudnabacteria bacterium RIFCSPHIGHO2_12_FULL_47_25]OGE93448.1 MAG: translation elongation factor Ts [Candidatus Doudnabacteria bacterium RIFCSPHIGHO2_02_FULL_48_21]OGE97853.1 MAG: translation elongation factor Ts [Candidatu